MVGRWTVLLCGQNVQRNFWRRLPLWPVHLLLENFSNETILILESSVNRGQDNGEPLVEEGETMIISSLSVLESKSWFLSSTACYSQNTIQNIGIFYRLDTSYIWATRLKCKISWLLAKIWMEVNFNPDNADVKYQSRFGSFHHYYSMLLFLKLSFWGVRIVVKLSLSHCYWFWIWEEIRPWDSSHTSN